MWIFPEGSAKVPRIHEADRIPEIHENNQNHQMFMVLLPVQLVDILYVSDGFGINNNNEKRSREHPEPPRDLPGTNIYPRIKCQLPCLDWLLQTDTYRFDENIEI